MGQCESAHPEVASAWCLRFRHWARIVFTSKILKVKREEERKDGEKERKGRKKQKMKGGGEGKRKEGEERGKGGGDEVPECSWAASLRCGRGHRFQPQG